MILQADDSSSFNFKYQAEKIWSVHHIIATDVFKEDREEDIDEAWRNTALQPCLDIVKRFL
uniref:Uncharacterized protein n=1 Tax=Solanum lycopersicum TaxID=4081 RepID=A0A3Q7IUR5_SOLLC